MAMQSIADDQALSAGMDIHDYSWLSLNVEARAWSRSTVRLGASFGEDEHTIST